MSMPVAYCVSHDIAILVGCTNAIEETADKFLDNETLEIRECDYTRLYLQWRNTRPFAKERTGRREVVVQTKKEKKIICEGSKKKKKKSKNGS